MSAVVAKGFKTVWHIPIDVLKSTVETSKTLREITTKCGFKNGCNYYDAILERIDRLEIDTRNLDNNHKTKRMPKQGGSTIEIYKNCQTQINTCTNISIPTEKETCLIDQVRNTIVEIIPQLIKRLIVNPLECVIDVDTSKIKGVVYMVYSHRLKTIIYIGSSRRFQTRKNSHRSRWLKTETNTKFYNYVVSNELINDIEFMPILCCDAGYGFEVHMECEMIKLCASIFPLQNENIPIRGNHTLDIVGVIYGLYVDNDDHPKYVGKSIAYYERVLKHMSVAYNTHNKKSKACIYKSIREFDDQKWPINLEFRVIEKCPMWLLDHRENYYIKLHNVKQNGWNSSNNMSTQEDVDEAKKDQNKTTACQQPVTCPHCNVTICNKYKLVLHVIRCQNNTSVTDISGTKRTKNVTGKGSINHITKTNKYQVRSPMTNGISGKTIGTFNNYNDAKIAYDEYNKKLDNGETFEFKERRKRGTGSIKITKNNRYQAQIPKEGGGIKCIGTYTTKGEAEKVLDSYFTITKFKLVNDDLC